MSTEIPSEHGHLPGLDERFRAWAEKHLLPEVTALRADAERVKTAVPAALKGVQSLAAVVGTLAKAAAPGASPEIAAAVAEAEQVAADVAAAAEGLLSRM